MECNCPDNTPKEELAEAAALLKYMIHHNRHHADELYDIANKLDGEARELVHAAVIQYEAGTAKLEQAYAKLGIEIPDPPHHDHKEED